MCVKAATFFADLVANGVQILATTHSDYFVTEINNLIKAQAIRRSAMHTEATKPGGGIELDPRNVAALRFERTKTGCVAEQLPIDPIDGIDESTFGDVVDAQYNDTIRLTEALDGPPEG